MPKWYIYIEELNLREGIRLITKSFTLRTEIEKKPAFNNRKMLIVQLFVEDLASKGLNSQWQSDEFFTQLLTS